MPTGYVSDGTPRVFWTEEEKAIIVREAVKLLDDCAVDSEVAAVRQAAINALPVERQRNKLVAITQLDWWPEAALTERRRKRDRERKKLERLNTKEVLIAAAQAKLDQAEDAADEPLMTLPMHVLNEPTGEAATPAPATTPLPTPKITPSAPVLAAAAAPAAVSPRIPAPIPVPIPVPAVAAAAAGADRLVLLRELLVDTLAEIVSDAVTKALSKAISANLLARPTAPIEIPQAAIPESVVVQSTPRSAVLVVGLGGLQHVEIEKRFHRHLCLRFVSPDESKDKLRDEADRAATVVVMTQRLTQSQCDIVKARTKDLIEVHGGVHELNQRLGTLVGWNGAAAH